MRRTPYTLTLLSPSTLRPLCVYDVCREIEHVTETEFVRDALDYKVLQAELRQAVAEGFLAFASYPRGFQPEHPFRPEPPVLGSHTQWRSVYEPHPWALDGPITL